MLCTSVHYFPRASRDTWRIGRIEGSRWFVLPHGRPGGRPGVEGILWMARPRQELKRGRLKRAHESARYSSHLVSAFFQMF